ncbi:MAG TPA: nucleotidyltransferase domain-containing protein [Nevskiaceae bacterium]|nr:nucleotidyltransferase domain-containing protein [Nevskiaceae bacterium]
MEQAHHPLLQQLATKLLAEFPELLAIYRFGSFGTENERPGSDIDLGLQGSHPLDPVSCFKISGELATFSHRDVDLVDLLRCSTVMRAQVVATGERVFCRDTYHCDLFAAQALSQYAHLNEARAGILEDIQRTGSVYG